MTSRAGRGDRTPAGWVWPEWLEGQLDPRSGFVADEWPQPVNRTARNWTAIGTVASDHRPVVDGRGLVTPTAGGWSLDWWIGAEDRWHLPSRDHAVRQRLVAGTPVVETALRVPGGDAVQRVYAVRAPHGSPADELVVVEIHNQTSVPFAVALAVRPYDTDSLSEVHRIDLDGAVVTVDGQVAVVFDRAPRLVAGSDLLAGDSAAQVIQGDAHPPPLAPVRCAAGLAQAAFLYPLAHGAVLRLVLPLAPAPATRPAATPPAPAGPVPATIPAARRPTPAGPAPATTPARPAPATRPAATPPAPTGPAPDGWRTGLAGRLPAAADAARSWQAQTDRGLRVELPAGPLADAWAASRRALLLNHPVPTGDSARSAPVRSPLRDYAGAIGALDGLGFHPEAAELLAAGARHQRPDGELPGPPGDGSATGVWLCALAGHWRMSGDDDLLERLAPAISRAVWAVGRPRPFRTRWLPGGSRGRLAGSGPDDLWRRRGLLEAACVLRATAGRAGRPPAGGPVGAVGEVPSRILPAIPETGPVPAPILDSVADALAWLAACPSPDPVDPAAPAVAAGLDAIRGRLGTGPACSPAPAGHELSPYLTACLAAVELRAGDRRALERLPWLLAVASPTWTWPELLDDRTGRGCRGEGHDGSTGAAFCTLVRDLLVHETVGGLALLGMLPAGWVGQGIEVHRAPTHAGELSYAVRWHGHRPALLWELRPRPGLPAVRLTAPGLDPGWSTEAAAGEALLAAPAGPVPEVGSFG